MIWGLESPCILLLHDFIHHVSCWAVYCTAAPPLLTLGQCNTNPHLSQIRLEPRRPSIKIYPSIFFNPKTRLTLRARASAANLGEARRGTRDAPSLAVARFLLSVSSFFSLNFSGFWCPPPTPLSFSASASSTSVHIRRSPNRRRRRHDRVSDVVSAPRCTATWRAIVFFFFFGKRIKN